jgi:hypothetical protein
MSYTVLAAASFINEAFPFSGSSLTPLYPQLHLFYCVYIAYVRTKVPLSIKHPKPPSFYSLKASPPPIIHDTKAPSSLTPKAKSNSSP